MGHAMVVSTVPFNQQLLGSVANKLGALTLEPQAVSARKYQRWRCARTKTSLRLGVSLWRADPIHGLGNRRITAKLVRLR